MCVTTGITFKDRKQERIPVAGTYHPTQFRDRHHWNKDKPDFIDSVAYVQLGNDLLPGNVRPHIWRDTDEQS